jgi:hypothetical protein
MYDYLAKRPDGAAPLRQLTEYAMGFVPAGPAWREGAAKRLTDARYRGAEGEPSVNERHRLVRTGSKRIVLKALHYEAKVGRLQKFEHDGRIWVRLAQEEKVDNS